MRLGVPQDSPPLSFPRAVPSSLLLHRDLGFCSCGSHSLSSVPENLPTGPPAFVCFVFILCSLASTSLSPLLPTYLPFSDWNSLLNSVWLWSCPLPHLCFAGAVCHRSNPVFLSCPLTSSLALKDCAVHSTPYILSITGSTWIAYGFLLV